MSEELSYRDQSEEEEEELLLDPDTFPTARYKAIRELGRGANGVVFMCMDRILQKKVAVKTLLMMTDEQLVSFQQEAKATSKLNHRNIVQVLDFGLTQSSTPYMALDFIEGVALDKYISKFGPLKASMAVEVFVQVCEALSYAHAAGVFHRDLKPENIIISESSTTGFGARLIDFGLADFKKDSQPTEFQGRTLVGTPAYMSPDQLAGKAYDARSEVYAFGCVLFEALSGNVPFEGATPLETLALHAHKRPPSLKDVADPDLEIPASLVNTVNRCMAKEPDNRYQSIDELRQALIASTLEETREDPVVAQPLPPTKQELQRRSLLFVIAFVVGAICVIAVAGYTVSKLLDDKSLQSELAVLDEKEDLASTLARKTPHIVEAAGGGHTIIGGTPGHSLKVLDGRHDIKALNLEFMQLAGNKCKYLVGLHLQKLSLSTCEMDRETLHFIATLSNLEVLYIRNSSGLKEINFGILERCKKLKDFSINRCTCPDDILFQISHLHSLEKLSLKYIPNLEQTDFPLLANLKKLTDLDIGGIPLDFDTYRDLAALPNVRNLAVSHLPDESASVLSSMNLESLGVSDSPRFSKAGLLSLTGIQTLKRLTLTACPLINPAVIRKFKQKLPMCRVQVNLESKQALVY